MNGKYFIDTDVFVYCFDDSHPAKKAHALSLIAGALKTCDGMISWQVIQEFLNVSTRKFSTPLTSEDAQMYLQKVLHPLCYVFPYLDIYNRALEIFGQTGYSFNDSLILAAALRGGCNILYSEDFKSHHQIDTVIVSKSF